MKEYLEQGVALYREMLTNNQLLEEVESAVGLIVTCLRKKNPVLVCGNGGSASDALHISGELVGRFNISRPGLNVLCLNSNVTVLTAWANDVSFETVFSRQVESHGIAGGVLWGLSTSGDSRNVIEAFRVAKELDMKTIAMTGRGGGELAGFADILIDVPAVEAARAQELHIPVYHYICAAVERALAA